MLINVGVPGSAIQFFVFIFPIDPIDGLDQPPENGWAGLFEAPRGAVIFSAFGLARHCRSCREDQMQRMLSLRNLMR
jgi:hypothetical protein